MSHDIYEPDLKLAPTPFKSADFWHTPNNFSLLTLTEYCRHTWLKGIIYTSTVTYITKRTKKYSLVHTLIIKIIQKIQQLFCSLIWIKRCKG